MLTGLLELVVEVSLDGLAEGSKLLLVFRLNIGQSNSSGSLLVNEGTKTSLTLDDGIGDSHLTAESRKPDDQLEIKDSIRHT